jgi:hypothetical protein
MTIASLEVMSPDSARWDEFVEKLEGPNGCNFREVDGESKWTCKGGMDKSNAARILREMRGVDLDATLAFFDQHGGHCDCEILFNVEDSFARTKYPNEAPGDESQQ